MQKFIAEQNVTHLRELLAHTEDEGERKKLEAMLADEEAKLESIQAERRGRQDREAS